MTARYSGMLLAKKPGTKENFTVLLYKQPEHYFDLFSDMTSGIIVEKEFISEPIDFIHLFHNTLEELQDSFCKYKVALKKNGSFWVGWPSVNHP
ncbi:MAG: hypothetical protein AAFZ89_15750 [Bacteroidota bacterium]